MGPSKCRRKPPKGGPLVRHDREVYALAKVIAERTGRGIGQVMDGHSLPGLRREHARLTGAKP